MIKNFEVDWDDYNAVSKLGNQIKTRLGDLNFKKKSRKQRNKELFDACSTIYNTDISSIYENVVSSPITEYYVYAHLDPKKKIAIQYDGRTTFAATLGLTHFPIYIGKGKGQRYNQLNRNETHRKYRQMIQKMNADIVPFIIKDELTEIESLMYESKLIDIFGLKIFGGSLMNLDEGHMTDQRRKFYWNEYSLLTGKRIHSINKKHSMMGVER